MEVVNVCFGGMVAAKGLVDWGQSCSLNHPLPI